MAVVYLDTYNNPPEILKHSSVCFGVFDGLHEGHRYEIEQAIADKCTSIAVTFDVDPDEIYNPGFKKIMTNQERIEALNKSGLDYVIVLKFNEIKNIEAIEFLNNFFGKYIPAHMHVGEGFRFGSNAIGDTKLLFDWGMKNNMKVHVHDLVKKDGRVVSSTDLRKLM